MIETTGTLNLKIAQLERRLKLLKQRQNLSSLYPTHRAKLLAEETRVQQQLQQLLQRHQMLFPSQSMADSYTEKPGNDETCAGKRPFYQVA